MPLLCALAGGPLLAAPEPTPPAEPVAPAASVTPGAGQRLEPAITLPVIKVTAARVHELDKEILKVEKQIAREKKKVKAGELDRALNNQKLTAAAAIFGGNSTSHLSAIAAYRVTLLESERGVLESMKLPRSLEELALLDRELEQLRDTRRNLDNISR